MVDLDLIPLTHVGRELVAGGFTPHSPGYDRLYKGALNGAFPAEQVVSNRWSVRRSDLPKVAAAFGVAAATKARDPIVRHRKAVSSSVAA